ncbi:MAG: MBL fold metallo-hydrolase [Bacteroidota bacterium]
MKKLAICLCIALSLATFCRLSAQDRSHIPVTKVKISKDIILYKTGETAAYPNMIAVKTTEGTVVFDALQYPDVAQRVREMIKKDFGGKVACLVNTHGWYDHTGGDEVFKDVPIIGHSKLKTEMPDFYKQMNNPQAGKYFEDMISKSESLRSTYPGDPKEIDEAIESTRNFISDLGKGAMKAIIPDTLIDDQYTLNMGDKTFKMYHNTPGYSESDIIIYIPEEKALIIGDVFNKNRLPWLNPATNLESWEKLFQPYLSEGPDVKYFIGTHGDVMTIDEVREQFNYLNKLNNEVKRLKGEGKTMEQANQELSLDKFPYLSKCNPYFYGTAIPMHSRNIMIFWRKAK